MFPEQAAQRRLDFSSFRSWRTLGTMRVLISGARTMVHDDRVDGAQQKQRRGAWTGALVVRYSLVTLVSGHLKNSSFMQNTLIQ